MSKTQVAVVAVCWWLAAAPWSSATAQHHSVTLSPEERDRSLAELPDIQVFAHTPSDYFLVDLDVVRTGHPYRGENAARPHAGGHVYFRLPQKPIPPDQIDRFPAVFAVADGIVSRIDYAFRLKEMFEPALDRRVANYRYGIGLMFAVSKGSPVVFHYSIEPFVDPGDMSFYKPFLMVTLGQRVKKGDIIARMYLPKQLGLARKSHIHFNLIGGRDHRFMAPAIFAKDIVQRFHSTWRSRGRQSDADLPACLGYKLAPSENPFGTGARETL